MAGVGAEQAGGGSGGVVGRARHRHQVGEDQAGGVAEGGRHGDVAAPLDAGAAGERGRGFDDARLDQHFRRLRVQVADDALGAQQRFLHVLDDHGVGARVHRDRAPVGEGVLDLRHERIGLGVVDRDQAHLESADDVADLLAAQALGLEDDVERLVPGDVAQLDGHLALHVVGHDDVLLADVGDGAEQVLDVDVLDVEVHLPAGVLAGVVDRARGRVGGFGFRGHRGGARGRGGLGLHQRLGGAELPDQRALHRAHLVVRALDDPGDHLHLAGRVGDAEAGEHRDRAAQRAGVEVVLQLVGQRRAVQRQHGGALVGPRDFELDRIFGRDQHFGVPVDHAQVDGADADERRDGRGFGRLCLLDRRGFRFEASGLRLNHGCELHFRFRSRFWRFGNLLLADHDGQAVGPAGDVVLRHRIAVAVHHHAHRIVVLREPHTLDRTSPCRLAGLAGKAVQIDRQPGRILQLGQRVVGDLAVGRNPHQRRAAARLDRHALQLVRRILHSLRVVARRHDVGVKA